MPTNPEKVCPITVREMFDAKREEWDLELITGEEGLERPITTFEQSRPGLALAGYYEVFSVERVQIIGLTETSYLMSLPSEERRRRLRRTLDFPIPCFIITRSLEALPEMVEILRELKVPLLRTSHITTPFEGELGQFLERKLAPRWSLHWVMMEVFGMGVLIQGKSGVGKSECALEMIQRGHLLVADDIVMVRRVSRGRLFAEPSRNLRYHMELRGLGIIDVELLFGVRSVREESELSLIVDLEKWDPEKEYERLGLHERYKTLFNCQVPHVTLPVEPGRNIALLIEVAALMQRLRAQGVNVALNLDQHIRTMMNREQRYPPQNPIDTVRRLVANNGPVPEGSPKKRAGRKAKRSPARTVK
ncbi:HPr(Ser) kinase/phosphatase [Candidatus Sumerlaeota bacterium]|nr:HPr(Ser) kinase/phosphatase [Candidatus Sumerlaeota bacterium]